MKLWVIQEIKFSNDPGTHPGDFLCVTHAVATTPVSVADILDKLRGSLAPDLDTDMAPIKRKRMLGGTGWVCGFTDEHYLRALPAAPDQIIQYQEVPDAAEPKSPKVCGCFPHGPNEPCTCSGCWACAGHVVGCTCDIAWDCEHRDG